MKHDYKGRGARVNPVNPFQNQTYATDDHDGIDEPFFVADETEVYEENPKKIISKNDSPDIPFEYSINPYQGCEHGCAYCYARPVHQYWGFNAGYDFERRIIVKKNAARLLEQQFNKKNYRVSTIMLSGNTDCYQPLERNYKITRSLLEVLLKYRHSVGIITKNALILRDLDLLKKLAEHKLVRVVITITTLDEGLRRNLEPRTSTSSIRLDTINKLSSAGIPTGIMMAPNIPSVNDHEIGDILPKASQAGALSASYTLLRLNGPLPEIFGDWLDKNMPERKTKILNKVKHIHGGALNDSNFGQRMRGKGNYAEMTHSLFQKIRQKHFSHKAMTELDADQFIRKGQLKLF